MRNKFYFLRLTPFYTLVAVNGSGDTTVAHEWLHAFADAGHVCEDGNIMVNATQSPCSNGATKGANTSPQDVSNLNTDW